MRISLRSNLPPPLAIRIRFRKSIHENHSFHNCVFAAYSLPLRERQKKRQTCEHKKGCQSAIASRFAGGGGGNYFPPRVCVAGGPLEGFDAGVMQKEEHGPQANENDQSCGGGIGQI